MYTEPEELKVDIVKYEVDAVHFMIDLDSVYKTSNGDLVYALDKNDVEERNIWQLVIIVNLIDGYTATFKTQGFRIRTKPKPAKPEQATGNVSIYCYPRELKCQATHDHHFVNIKANRLHAVSIIIAPTDIGGLKKKKETLVEFSENKRQGFKMDISGTYIYDIHL